MTGPEGRSGISGHSIQDILANQKITDKIGGVLIKELIFTLRFFVIFFCSVYLNFFL